MRVLLLFILLSIEIGLNAISPQDSNTAAIKQYMQKRETWLQRDCQANFSEGLHLSKAEKKLDSYLQKFCYHFWNHFLESNLFPPTKNFAEAKPIIESTLLFRILKRVPKGGVLHIHSDSTGNAAWLVNRAIQEKKCYIYMDESDTVLKGTMRYFPTDEIPHGFVSMQELATVDKNFVPDVVNMITMSAVDSASVNPWIKFNACFTRIDGLLTYEPIFKDFYTQAFEAIAEDNIQLVELRTRLDPMHAINGKIIEDNGVVEIYRGIADKVREKFPHFILKLIVSDVRTQTLGQAKHSLERAFKLRAENPDIIIGYDLVGYETTGHPLLYYLESLLLASHEYEKKYQTDLPYFFHAGESGWEDDKNPYDAVLLKSKRIGHGFNLMYFPCLIQEIKKDNICLEICPVSNQVLGYVKDLRIHPAAVYLKQGIPCILSSDDPLLFKTTGLSYDFWEAIMAWNLNLSDIKQLCMNSITYSSLSEKEMCEAMQVWQKEWDQFVRNTLEDLQIPH